MSRPFSIFSRLLFLSTLFAASSICSAQIEQTSRKLKVVFKEHCFLCHGTSETEADIDLTKLKSVEDFLKDAEVLEKMVRVLVDHEMPPKDEKGLSDSIRKQTVLGIEEILEEARRRMPFKPSPIRRMNRFQYNNAVVDLLELERDIFQLNERLMRRRQDYFHPATGKMPNSVLVSSRPLSKDIDNQRPEGFKGVAPFPQDQRAEFGFDNRGDHLSMSPLLMESYLNLSQTIVESSDLNPKECRSWNWLFASPSLKDSSAFRIEGERRDQLSAVSEMGQTAAQVLGNKAWSGSSHLFWTCPEDRAVLKLKFQVTDPGDGLVLALTQASDYGEFQLSLDGKQVAKKVDLYSPKVQLKKLEIKNLPLTRGHHTLSVVCVGKNQNSKQRFFGLDFLEITGRSSSQQEPRSEADELRIRLKKLLRRAFRRKIDNRTLERFVSFAVAQRKAGATFEATMKRVVSAVLTMPEFLYLHDTAAVHTQQNEIRPQRPEGRQPVNDFELATRLAQFFWSSIPDDELLDLADSGKLKQLSVLSKQIDRMMNDRRSSRFCENFPGQWLQLDRLVTAIPDRKKFPYFYYAGYRTSMHMMSEPLLLFETVFVENRSVMDLIAPDFTWESNQLRKNYLGRSDAPKEVQVQRFNRVPIKDPRRGGIITNAAILTMNSTPVRTQPITRGAWLNAVIFNDPPEPPPADVPPLPETDQSQLEKLTIRERLAAHRTRADCAGCHNRIDPLGFALENFGPTGVWREKYENGRKVDVSGVLFNRYPFSTLAEFKDLIVKNNERFLRGFTAHLLSYGLGRELGPADSPALKRITRSAIDGKIQLRSIMKSVAMSEPFLHKNTGAGSAAGTQKD